MYKIIGVDQKEYGPITADLIRQWISEGRLNAQTQACLEGTQEWKPLGTFPEFALANVPGSSPTSASPPGVIKVFGILNIVFGALALLCSPFSLLMIPFVSKQLGNDGFMTKWLFLSAIIGIAGGAVMLASGVGLCKLRPWARQLAVYYSIFACLISVLNSLITVTHMPGVGPNPEAQRAATVIGAIFGVVIAWTYNILLIYFLSKQAVKEALGENR